MKPNLQIERKCENAAPLRTAMAGFVVFSGGQQIRRRRNKDIPIEIVRLRAGMVKGFQPSRFAE